MAARLLKLFGLLLVLGAALLAMSRAPDVAVEGLVARWAPPPSDFIDVDGQIVHLRDVGPRGDPLPLVLIHGTSSSLHTWEGWAQALAPHRRVITFDLPGFGLTGPRADADYRVEADVRFVLRLLDRLQVPQAVLGGNSLGGEIAWRAAHAAPQRVRALVLVDAAGLPFERTSLPLGWWFARLPLLNRVGEYVLPRALVAQGLALAYGGPDKVSAALVDRHFELTLRAGNRRALAERLRLYRPGAEAEALASLKLPTLVLWGGRDALIPARIGTELHARIAGSTLVVFDDLAHLPHEEDPVRTLVPVRAFLGID